MLKLFAKYTSIGVLNTLIHWGVFALVVASFGSPQSIANLSGFCVAVTFSFFMNARYTFSSKTTKHRYFIFVGFMGALAFISGVIADRFELPAITTLIFFSGSSLVLGFLYSKFVVFKD
ncbi:TPA: GtrA family protein [Salmonella enterica]|nr:GtrA family protein [Salmonella enterica]ECC9555678.1 GtrA family protein [Salmonella enterica subsp. salamae]EHJ5091968.1 GtrA family protein [Salmonella enterica subsp. salamae serovar 16:m,t:-]HCM1922979.1 GtrA family protein [Salmonella enterica subsp. salamae serovar 16:m,t:e,n,x]EAV1732547.1 GtrA family protein [Salmonella enterica]